MAKIVHRWRRCQHGKKHISNLMTFFFLFTKNIIAMSINIQKKIGDPFDE